MKKLIAPVIGSLIATFMTGFYAGSMYTRNEDAKKLAAGITMSIPGLIASQRRLTQCVDYERHLTWPSRDGMCYSADEPTDKSKVDPLPDEIRAATSRRAHGTEDAGRPGPTSESNAEPK